MKSDTSMYQNILINFNAMGSCPVYTVIPLKISFLYYFLFCFLLYCFLYAFNFHLIVNSICIFVLSVRLHKCFGKLEGLGSG